MDYRKIEIANAPEAVRAFFHKVGDQAIIIEKHGKPLGILYPSRELNVTAEGTLADVKGGWAMLPDSVLQIGRRGWPPPEEMDRTN